MFDLLTQFYQNHFLGKSVVALLSSYFSFFLNVMTVHGNIEASI